MSKPDDDELRALWRSQNEKEPPMSLENVMKQETTFARKVKWRNASEYIAGAFVVFAFGRRALTSGELPPFSRAGCVAIILGCAVALGRIRLRGTPANPPPAEAATREHLAHYRTELLRQRKLLMEVPRWYLAPFVPGMALFFAGIFRAVSDAGLSIAEVVKGGAGPVAIVVGIFAAVALLNHHAAKKLTRKIEALGDE